MKKYLYLVAILLSVNSAIAKNNDVNSISYTQRFVYNGKTFELKLLNPVQGDYQFRIDAVNSEGKAEEITGTDAASKSQLIKYLKAKGVGQSVIDSVSKEVRRLFYNEENSDSIEKVRFKERIISFLAKPMHYQIDSLITDSLIDKHDAPAWWGEIEKMKRLQYDSVTIEGWVKAFTGKSSPGDSAIYAKKLDDQKLALKKLRGGIIQTQGKEITVKTKFTSTNLFPAEFTRKFLEALRSVNGEGEDVKTDAMLKNLALPSSEEAQVKNADGTKTTGVTKGDDVIDEILHELNEKLRMFPDEAGPITLRVEYKKKTVTVFCLEDCPTRMNDDAIDNENREPKKKTGVGKKGSKLRSIKKLFKRANCIIGKVNRLNNKINKKLEKATVAESKFKINSITAIDTSKFGTYYRSVQENINKLKTDVVDKLSEQSTPDIESELENLQQQLQNVLDDLQNSRKSRKQLKKLIGMTPDFNFSDYHTAFALPVTTRTVPMFSLTALLPSMLAAALPPVDSSLIVLNKNRGKIRDMLVYSHGYFTGEIKRTQIEFCGGYIERIQVEVLDKKTNHTYYFCNNYPIPFSSEQDYKKLVNYILYNRTSGDYPDALAIQLGDFLECVPIYRRGRRDFSPQDGVLVLVPEEPVQILPKSRLGELFEATIYTDFIGLDEDKPNGLVQTEITRKVALWNQRIPFLSAFRVHEGDANQGFFQYIEPQLVISKIEQRNRNYPVPSINTINQNALQHRAYITPINLLNYSHTTIGVRVNMWLIDLKQIKSMVEVNSNFNFGIIGLQDSIYKISGSGVENTGFANVIQVPYFTANFEASYSYSGDERFGFTGTGVFIRPWLIDNNVTLIASQRLFDQSGYVAQGTHYDTWMFGLRFKAWLRPGSFFDNNGASPNTGSVFFRFQYTQSMFEKTQKYFQVQLGYTYPIMFVRKR